MNLRLFVISTIADAQSARRRHADAVFAGLIQAACDLVHAQGLKAPRDVTVVPLRGERDPNNEAIDVRILDAILTFDLLAVVAFEPNGNVFYEAGIAHAAGRPLLLLKHDDFAMPIDLAHYPYITYAEADLAAAEAGPDHPRVALAAAIREQIQRPRFRDPFRRSDLGALGGERMLRQFRDLNYSSWSEMLLLAKHEIVLAGLSLWELINPVNQKFFRPDENSPDGALPPDPNANIADLVAYAIGRGVNVTVMFMSPDNPVLPAMLLQAANSFTRPEVVLTHVRQEIAMSVQRWTEVAHAISGQRWDTADKPGTMRVIQVANGIIPQRVTWTDLECVTTPFFNSMKYNSGGPAVRTRSDHPWHILMRADLQLLIDHNGGSTSQRAQASVG